ncbi:hypothetical protein [Paludisphaera mucosa]|uniref:Uncharacterized protein n=1 Tax=Paludisphaera mucosa TaxID=3030827 RepID=A0ABT6FDY0_9BACT|nr:hypothetical protein [Paludisphaera mucosa]MDG3005778.1 hypothetical protein [Paludisphaera mucosa]
MATATGHGLKLSKPRQSLAILEAAVLTAALVLLAWLALWLIHRHAQGLRVEAGYFRPARLTSAEVPFLAADARAVVGGGGPEVAGAASPESLLDATRAACSRPGGPVLIYVSAPMLDAIGGTRFGGAGFEPRSLRDLIEGVVRSAKCDVVLALDLAQVDSDRDLGVFGNVPYQGLAAIVEGIKPGDHAVFVLTSAAPAQKSWGSDALGRSVFAHFLREGLAGDARGWDATEIPGRVTVEGLHRYVHHHVARWAREYRDSVQTPMLLRIGESRRPVALAFATKPPAPPAKDQATPRPAPGPSKESAPTENKDAAAAKPEPPAVEPRVALMKEVVDEWRKHDALVAQVPRPYRSHPAAIRSYQAALLRAERRLRSAWSDPASLDAAREELRAATQRREDVVAALKRTDEAAKGILFRPVAGDEVGKRALTEALTFLTGSGPADPTLRATSPPAAAPPPAETKDRPEAAAKPAAPGRPEPPRVLADALPSGFPDRYLELQLPAWGLRYIQEFKVPDYFKDDRRSAILHRLVEVRARAEEALAVDRRGLGWILPEIAKGDDERRRLQDQIFAPDQTTGEAGKVMLEAIPTFARAHYDPAIRTIRAFHEVRTTWERIAAELPDIAEWAVRARARRPDARSLDEHPLPPEVILALEHAETLVRALDQPVPTEGDFGQAMQARVESLHEATNQAEAALESLEKQLLAAARADARDWVAMDAALGTPWIPAESRRPLLEAVVRHAEPVRIDPDHATLDLAATRPADPGFWALAGGLAALDERLRAIAGGASAADADGTFVDQAWAAAKDAPGSPEVVDAAAAAFRRYEEAANRFRVTATLRRSARFGGETRTPEDLRALLQVDDRAVRLLGRAEAQADAAREDGLVEAWDRLTRLRTLAFQAERLHLDYVANAPAPVQEVIARARVLDVQEPRDPFAAGDSLALKTEPPAGAPLKIGGDGKAEIRLGLARPGDDDDVDRIPPGRAFVGLAAPPNGLSVGAAPAASPPGALRDVSLAAAGKLETFAIRQLDPASNAETYELRAMAFYRGRVDPRASAPIEVVPQAYAEPVTLQVAFDPEALKATYGEKLAALVEDQFKVHPGSGYMHRGKSATYRLNFKNVTFRDLTLYYKRTLVAPGGGEPEIPIDEAEKSLPLPAGAVGSVVGEVTSAQVPMDKPRDLRVAWRIGEKKDSARTLSVHFRQIDVKSYMTFLPSIGFDSSEGVYQECFIVKFVRSPDDPVREPIRGGEVSATIQGVKRSLGPKAAILPGQSFRMTHSRTPGATTFTWSAEIENDQIKPEEFRGP